MGGKHASCMTAIKHANPWCPSDPVSPCQSAWAGGPSAGAASASGLYTLLVLPLEPCLRSEAHPRALKKSSSSYSFRGRRWRAKPLILMPDSKKLLTRGQSFRNPGKGPCPESDQNGCSAGPVALGGFQGWGQGPAQAQLFPELGCPTPRVTKLQVGTGKPRPEPSLDWPP